MGAVHACMQMRCYNSPVREPRIYIDSIRLPTVEILMITFASIIYLFIYFF